MTPLEVFLLAYRFHSPEFTILLVLALHVSAVSTIFLSVPLMIVFALPIVVPLVVVGSPYEEKTRCGRSAQLRQGRDSCFAIGDRWQWIDLLDVLAMNSHRFPARGQYSESATLAKQAFDAGRDGLDEVLAVIEDDNESPRSERRAQGVRQRRRSSADCRDRPACRNARCGRRSLPARPGSRRAGRRLRRRRTR